MRRRMAEVIKVIMLWLFSLATNQPHIYPEVSTHVVLFLVYLIDHSSSELARSRSGSGLAQVRARVQVPVWPGFRLRFRLRHRSGTGSDSGGVLQSPRFGINILIASEVRRYLCICQPKATQDCHVTGLQTGISCLHQDRKHISLVR